MNPIRIICLLSLLTAVHPHAEIEQGLVEVVQLNGDNTNTSLTLSLSRATSPRVAVDLARSNLGDYTLDFSHPDDIASGVLVSTVAENGRNNSAVGGPAGTKYPIASIEETSTEYFIAVHEEGAAEFNVNCTFAHFPFSDWLGGVAENSTNNGAITSLRGSAGINLGAEFVDVGNGTYTLDLTGLGGHSGDGILLVNGAKNENNFALSRANLGDGTFTIFCHDRGTNGGTYERDPVAFVFLPLAHGSDQIVAMGRINGDGSPNVETGSYSISKGGAGTWFLTIPGHSPDTGNLLISSEGGAGINVDNFYSHRWDPVTSRWIIQGRDVPDAVAQDLGAFVDAFSFAFLTTPASTIFVDPGATGSNDGRSWVNAFTDLQSALTIATSGDTILVAEGLYTPGASRTDSFVLVDGVATYGGFPAGGSTFALRDPAAHPTILSGDITGDDSQSPVATDALSLTGQTNNSYNVVTGDNLGSGTVLDGFTITAGYAGGASSFRERGGGVRLVSSSPTLSNLVFSGCTVRFFGGGLYNLAGSPVLRNVEFIGNRAENNGGAGLWSDGGAGGSTVTNARFINNTTSQFNGGGGGVYLSDSSVITDALFVGNNAVGSSAHGGAVRINNGTPTLVNVTIAGNHGTNGGGIGIEGTAIPILFNCLIWGNTASNGPGIWGATDPASSNNLIQDEPGASNPWFVRDPDSGDGNWSTTADNDYGDLHLQGASPAIEAGDNAANPEPLDLDGAPRVIRSTIDLGAFEMLSPPWMVDAAATGANNGLTWTDAFTDLQSALAVAVAGEAIWVAEGTYKPTSGTSQSIYFLITQEIELYGGFPAGGSDFAGRDPAIHPTILSGEINSAAATDNSLHVVVIAPALATCLGDGFTIRDGYADGTGNGGRGGGIFVENDAAPVFREVLVTGNHAINDGGGMMVETGGTAVPIFENVTFDNNTAADAGGAVYNWNRSPDYNNCRFLGNVSTGDGGAMYNNASTALIFDCWFESNQGRSGGAIYNTASPVTIAGTTFLQNDTGTFGSGGAIFNNLNSDATITSCRFFGNDADVSGGALRNRDDSDVTVVNSLFSGNSAETGGAIWNGSIANCTLTIINSTLSKQRTSNGTSGAIHAIDVPVTMQNSILWGSLGGTGIAGGLALSPQSANNLIEGMPGASDPLFVNPNGADFILGTHDDDLHLQPNSPAIGQGGNALVPSDLPTDLDGAPRIQPHDVDLGAYESNKMNVTLADVPLFVPHGDETTIPGWAPDGTAFNGGSGFAYQFNLLGTTGGLTFDNLPLVDPDGTLRFTLTDHSTGSATFEVLLTDPGSNYAAADPQTITISTGQIRRVHRFAGGNNDGTTWDDAFTDLDTALANATHGDEFWLAQGQYTPATSFTVTESLAIYGGFLPGPGAGTFLDRGASASATKLLGGNDPEEAGNAPHVVVIDPDLDRVVLDRLSIENGYAVGAGIDSRGAGVYVHGNSTPEFRDVDFQSNHAADDGGAVYFEDGGTGTPVFERVIFEANECGDDGGAAYHGDRRPAYLDCDFTDNRAAAGAGGALHGSPLRVTTCLFQDNTCFEWGGAIYNTGGNVSILASSFYNNAALRPLNMGASASGAIHNPNTDLTATLCLFFGNSAGDAGGAIQNGGTGSVEIDNCLFHNNVAGGPGGAIFGGATIRCSTFFGNSAGEHGGAIRIGGASLIQNSILWGNSAGVAGSQIHGGALSAASTNNIVQDGITDDIAGTFSQDDPLFVNAPAGNFTLQSASPAVNTGDKTLVPQGLVTDLNGDPRFVPFQLDIGAYESPHLVVNSRSFLDVTLGSRPTGAAHSVECWVSPGHGLEFSFAVVAASGDIAFDSGPTVLPNGTLQFALTAGTFGSAVLEATATDPGGGISPFSFQFGVTAPSAGAAPTATASFSYIASQSLSSDPLLKVARIRAYQHPPGTRRGIAIMPDGFSTRITTFPDPASEIGEVPLKGIRKRAWEAGFDVYTVHWNDPRSWIEDHAVIIADLLQGIAGAGFPGPGHPSGHNELLDPDDKVAVIAVSMGGLVARTALCYLDHHALPYRCDLFLSVDSPQEGAYIPIGLQYLGEFLASFPSGYISAGDLARLNAENNALDQPAPREMLVLHKSRAGSNSTPGHARERDSLLALLASLGTWPSNPNLRMAAIANGRGDGQFEDNGNAYPGPANPAGMIMLDWESDETEENISEIDIPGICTNDITIGVTATGKLRGKITAKAYAVNPSSPGTSGSSLAFIGNAVMRVTMSGTATNDDDRSGSFTLSLSGSRSTVKTRLRNGILDVIVPNGINFAWQNRVYDDIDDGIEDKIDQIMELAPLRASLNTRNAYSTQHWDWLPGGVRDTAKTAAENLEGGGNVVNHVSNNHCFIPTTSALGLSTAISPQGLAIPPNAADLSPFDALYHFGTHDNTSHLRNDVGIDFWLSEIVTHELGVICGDFAPKLDQLPIAVHWRGPRLLEEFDAPANTWFLRSSRRDGLLLLPDPAPEAALFRLSFPQVYENDPVP